MGHPDARRPAPPRRPRFGLSAVFAALALLAACDLTEVTLAEPEDVIVVEGLIQITPVFPEPEFRFRDMTYVLLHRTLGDEVGSVPEARVRIGLRRSGEVLTLPERGSARPCADSEPVVQEGGTCYGPLAELGLRPGDVVDLRVDLPDGGVIRSATTIPGDFDLLNVPEDGECILPPRERLDILWSRSPGTWAYVAETSIFGLPEALEREGIELEEPVDDPLNLLGLAVSAEDTTVVFPSEFGVFSRGTLERELALLLQEGLPPATSALVGIGAADRNYVNWVRGGNFNPSGRVRVPSVVGDGTGFFGSVVVRAFQLFTANEPGGSLPRCGEGGRG